MFFSNRSFKWVRASARNLGAGLCPLGAFGRAAASPQTRQMRCWLSSERTTNPSSRRKRQDSRSLSLVLFPPKPLRWVSAGALLGEVIKLPCYIFYISVWGDHLPSGCCGCVGTTWRGVYFSRKTAFSEWVLCADGRAVPSCTQCFFGTSVWGVVSLPSACASCCRNAGRPRVTVAYLPFYAATVLALCGQNIPTAGTHATPAPNRAHSGSHAETRRVLRVDGDDVFGSGIIDPIGPFQADQPISVALAEGHRDAVPP